ncbi:hypothetical protein Tco_1342949 [Tanacetum coccineum]
MRRRMKQLRLHGVATRLNCLSEDVDVEREMEAPPDFQSRPSKERKIRCNVYPQNNVYPPSKAYLPSNVYPPSNIYPLSNVYPPSNLYPPSNGYNHSNTFPTHQLYSSGVVPYMEHLNYEESPSPLVKWIEDFHLPDGLRIPPHVGYYDGKGDLDEFIYASEGATKMEKWVMPVSCHMFAYLLKDAARVWWNNLPKGVVLSYEDLKKRFRTYFNQQKKQTKTYLAINGIKRKEG